MQGINGQSNLSNVSLYYIGVCTIREYLIQGTYKPFSTWPVESPDSGLCTAIRQKGLY